MKNIDEEIEKNADCQMDKSSKYYQFGYDYLGPFLTGFTLWLYRKLKKNNHSKIFFLARDGYLMKRAFDILPESGIETRYVYFSRKSLRLSFLWRSEDYRDSLKYLSRERYISIAMLLEYYGFHEDERQNIASETGMNLNSEYPYERLADRPELEDLYDRLRPRIDERSKEQDELLERYVRQEEMSGRIAIADVGWYGNMQLYLEKFMKLHQIDSDIDGFYIGIIPVKPLDGTVHGFLYQPGNDTLRKKVLCFFGVYEKLFQSREGSTNGYRLDSEKNLVVPDSGKYEYADSYEDSARIAAWQDGAIDCFQSYLRAHEESREASKSWKHISLKETRKMAEKLVMFGVNPPLWGTKLFSFLCNVDGTRKFYISQKSIFQYSPLEFRSALSNSPWKTGFMKSAFRIPFPYYCIYAALKK